MAACQLKLRVWLGFSGRVDWQVAVLMVHMSAESACTEYQFLSHGSGMLSSQA